MTDETVKKLMYGNKHNSMKKFVEKATAIKEKAVTRDSVLLEINGKTHHIPTHFAYSQLLKENIITKNDLRKAQSDIARLNETIKNLDNALKIVEVGLANKAEKYDD